MITLTIATAKALLKFASTDKARPSLASVGISQGGLAATDGFAAVQFYIDIDPYTATTYDRMYFPRAYVETALKVAVARKEATLKLDHENHSLGGIRLHRQFPPLPEIIPLAGAISTIDHLNINAVYLALLPLVTNACETEHCSLTVANIDQPVRFDIKGRSISAVVIISPKQSDFSGE